MPTDNFWKEHILFISKTFILYAYLSKFKIPDESGNVSGMG